MSSNQEIEKKRAKTEQVLANIYNLPAMPNVMIEIHRLLENPKTSAAELSAVISKDQSLVTKILTIANSPLYGLPRRVSTIDFAILIIGFNDIKNIVTALSLIDTFKNKTDKSLNQNHFWIHSLISGVAAKRLAEDLGYRIGGEAFVVGLLHDLGIPIMHRYLHSNFLIIKETAEKEDKMFWEVEKDVLGLTHEDIARFLTLKWNLPPELVSSISCHHNPADAAESLVLTSVAHVADYMTNIFIEQDYFWDKGLQLNPLAVQTLKFSTEQSLMIFMENYKEMCLEQVESLGKIA